MTTLPREQYWQQHMDTWQSSELSQNAYCREHNLRPNQFSYWKSRLQTLNNQQTSKPSTQSSAFIPLKIANTAPTGGLCLRLPNGFELSGIERQHLPIITKLLEVLR